MNGLVNVHVLPLFSVLSGEMLLYNHIVYCITFQSNLRCVYVFSLTALFWSLVRVRLICRKACKLHLFHFPIYNSLKPSFRMFTYIFVGPISLSTLEVPSRPPIHLLLLGYYTRFSCF